eukprot:Sdes_comp18507_c1_seq1m8547
MVSVKKKETFKATSFRGGKKGKEKRGKNGGKKQQKTHDLFSLALEEKESISKMKKEANKYDVDIYEYELPSDFEDEEIDEDEAFPENEAMEFSNSAKSSKKSISRKKPHQLDSSEDVDLYSEDDDEEQEHVEEEQDFENVSDEDVVDLSRILDDEEEEEG